MYRLEGLPNKESLEKAMEKASLIANGDSKLHGNERQMAITIASDAEFRHSEAKRLGKAVGKAPEFTFLPELEERYPGACNYLVNELGYSAVRIRESQ